MSTGEQLDKTLDYSKYYAVPQFELSLFHWMHPKVVAHIKEIEGLAVYLLEENQQLRKSQAQFEERLKVLEQKAGAISLL